MTPDEYQPRYKMQPIGSFGDYAPARDVPAKLFGKDNLRVWGKAFVNKEVGHVRGSVVDLVRGWVVESWSEDGAPHWQPQMHWLDGKDRKPRCLFPTEAGLQLGSVDNEIEPERAKFIRTAVKDWELWRELRY